MLNKNSIFIAICLSIFFYLGTTNAQYTTPDISQVKYLYEELRFEEAIKFGQHVLKAEDIKSAQHLEYIHQYMAFSFYIIGKIDSSRVHFLSLLSINPEIALDPVETSPKIIDFFNQIKVNFQEINENQNVISFPKYIFIEDKRPDAAWRSALFPGWGQYYKGQPTRAYILGGAFLTSAVIFGVSLVNENRYKDSYHNSTDPDDISSNYDKYNNWSKIRQLSTYTTIGIWLLSFADALWSDYPKIELNYLTTDHNTDLLSVKFSF